MLNKTQELTRQYLDLVHPVTVARPARRELRYISLHVLTSNLSLPPPTHFNFLCSGKSLLKRRGDWGSLKGPKKMLNLKCSKTQILSYFK